jgi:hypothetical protein
MPYWWWILPALTGLPALGLLAGGIGAIARHKPYRGLGEIFTGGALLALAAVIVLFGLDTQTYSRLTYERPVATLALHRTGDDQFDATVAEADMVAPSFALGAAYTPPASKTYPLKGDEWRIEARVLKWNSWANMLGLDARYRLERLSGEYTDTALEQNVRRSTYDLRPADDYGALTRLCARLHRARLVDTVYGSAALMPMADGAQYSLAMTQTGLIARPANDQAAEAVGGWK